VDGGDDPNVDGRTTVVSPAGRHRKSRSSANASGDSNTGWGIVAGQRVGRYVIREPMAEGGMGVVYLAHDPELDRAVAIKLIRPGAAEDSFESSARLQREAQAMARLSHPNVVVVYDVGSVEGHIFLAMEYVRGQTLRQWLTTHVLGWHEIVELFVAAGRGLVAAHEVGIVHRDFKPENVLVRDDGRVQVTDFGLARGVREQEQQERQAPRPASASGLLSVPVTVTGDVLGTPLYMAPEQHRREPTDARTDQFSFCVALYEALCGHPPFGDPAYPEFRQRVLDGKVDPPPSHLPAYIRRVLLRGLEPTLDRRFPSLQGLLAELDRRRPVRRPRWAFVAVAALAAVAAAIAVFALGHRDTPPVRVLRMSQLTREANLVLDPAISPDGQRLAYASGQLGHMQLYVRPLAGGSATALATELPGDHRAPQWSRDGSQIAFQSVDVGYDSAYEIDVVASSGGPAHRFIAPAGKSVAMPAWSPDGVSIAYIRFNQHAGPPWELVVARADGSMPRSLITLETDESLSTPSWSPDSKHVAFSKGNAGFYLRGNIAPASIWTIDASGGAPVRVTSGSSLDHGPVWAPDGRSLLFVSDRDGTRDVYQIAVDDRGAAVGPPSRLTVGLNPHMIAIVGDKRVICSVFTYRTNLWSVALPHKDVELTLADAQPVTTGNQIIESVDPSPDGRWLAFDSNLRGRQNLYVMPATGGEPVAVTTGSANDFAPAWSPDAQHIAFHSFQTGTRNLFVTDRDGSHVTELTTGSVNSWSPQWSPDGHTIAFFSDRSGELGVYTVSATGGTPQLLAKGTGPRWAPDGQSLTFTTPHGLWTIPAAGGTPSQLLAVEHVSNHKWSRDGRLIYFRQQEPGGIDGIWALPAAGGSPHRVLRLADPARHSDRVEFAVDDHRFLLPLTEHDADLWLLELDRAP
jgi:Tol biopolymer transport system component/serine/threonine protein kinase